MLLFIHAACGSESIDVTEVAIESNNLSNSIANNVMLSIRLEKRDTHTHTQRYKTESLRRRIKRNSGLGFKQQQQRDM